MSHAQESKFVVITGATGRLGYHVVKEFVSVGYEVRILTRSLSKAKSLFSDVLDHIELFEIDFFKEINSSNQKIFNEALLNSKENTPVTYVVSISGAAGFVDRKKTEILDYKTHKFLIDSSKNVPSLKKFIYISTMAITRPWSIVSLFLNLYIKNVMSWKLETENYLRKSGLNYIVIRPGGLIKEQDSKSSAITVAQGDKDMGLIERNSVAKVVISACGDQNLENNVTFEVFSKKSQKNQEYVWSTPNLKKDDERSIISNRHFRTRKIIVGGFWLVTVAGLSVLFRGSLINFFENRYRLWSS